MKNYFEKGFTLTEVIVAMGIFSIGVLGIFSFFTYSSQTIRVARSETTGSNLANGFLEEELAKSYGELIPGTSAKTRVSDNPASPYYNYQKQIEITLIDSDLNNSVTDLGLKKIIISIFWPQGSYEKSIQSATIKTQR